MTDSMLLDLGLAILSLVLFSLSFVALGGFGSAREAIGLFRKAAVSLRHEGLSDIEKERLARNTAIQLLGAGLRVVGVVAMSLLAGALPLFGADLVGLADAQRISAVMMSPAFVAVVLAGWLAYCCIVSLRRNLRCRSAARGEAVPASDATAD